MKHARIETGPNSERIGGASPVGTLALRLLPLAALLSACGGGGGGDGGGMSNQGNAIVRIGMQRQYVGTTSRSVVYVNPTATTPNNTLAYSFVQNQSVEQAPAGTAASFDVHNSYTYTVTQDPGIGSVPLSQTVDTYENLSLSGNMQTVSSVGQKTTLVSNDETSDALGNGPYTETTVTTASYPTVRNGLSYPLQTGETQTVPQSASETIDFSDVNVNGTAPSNGSNVAYTYTRNENDDGSFSYHTAYVNGNTFDRTQNSNGTGSQTYVTATANTTSTVGLPTVVGGVNTIPVAVTANGTTPHTTDYSAADWYPNNGTASSPLVSVSRVVVGPVASLPAACNGAVVRADIHEVDTTTHNFSPMDELYAVTTTRSFNSGDAVALCQLTNEVQSNYDLRTGALVSTITTATTTLLNAINY